MDAWPRRWLLEGFFRYSRRTSGARESGGGLRRSPLQPEPVSFRDASGRNTERHEGHSARRWRGAAPRGSSPSMSTNCHPTCAPCCSNWPQMSTVTTVFVLYINRYIHKHAFNKHKKETNTKHSQLRCRGACGTRGRLCETTKKVAALWCLWPRMLRVVLKGSWGSAPPALEAIMVRCRSGGGDEKPNYIFGNTQTE